MVTIQLDPFERKLILKYGYPFADLEALLKELSNSKKAESISFDGTDLDMVTGQLSRSINHGEVPEALLDAVDALCYHLESHM